MLPRAALFAGAAMLAATAATSAIAATSATAVVTDPRFERIERASGPSHNSIFALAQDRAGFLWIGTQDGLNRFDGERFAVWRHDPREPSSLSANRVNAVLEDASERLWIATAAGVDRFDRSARRFDHFVLADPGGRSASALELIEDPRGGLWAGSTRGLFRWHEERSGWVSETQELAGRTVRRIRPDGQGGLWLLADRVLLRLREGRVVARIVVPGESSGLGVDHEGRPWLDPAELRSIDGVALAASAAVPPASIQALLIGSPGEIWAGTHLGLRRRSAAGEVRDLRIDAARPLANFVAALLFDDRGILWVGTENGLYRHDPAAGRFLHHAGDPAGDAALHVSALAEDAEGTIWVGTFGAGLHRLEGSEAGAILRPAGISLPQPAIWSMLAVRGALVVAGDGWLCTLATGTVRADCAHGIAGLRRVGALAEDELGELWLAEIGTLHRRTGEGWRHYPLPSELGVFGSEELVQVLPETSDVWVGGFGGALKRFERAGERFHLIGRADSEGRVQNGPVFDLLRSRAGALWLATGDGLSRYDEVRGRFDHFGPAEGLPGSNVYSLLEDGNGRLWLGTNRGLARFVPRGAEPPAVRVYGPGEGVGNVEFNRHVRLRTADGRFLLGGMAGITEWRPEEVVDDPRPPRVALAGLEVVGREGVRQVEPHGLERLELGPDDAALAIEFVAVDLSSAPARRFAYRLEGLDPDWIEPDSGHVARYAGLAPGEYRFEVRAANGDGLWSAKPAELAVIVVPPFWATVWFRAAIVAAIVALLSALYRWRVRQLIELERMRLRIAGDLHDELGSDLSGIALASSRLLSRRTLEPADRLRLSEIEEASLRVLRGLRDIVWYVDPEHDTLESTAQRMRAVARDLLPEVEIRFVEQFADAAAGIEMSARRQIFLVFKELVHNVARHARATVVEIKIEARDGELRLDVVDDGRGFEPVAASSGSGLASLRRRASQIGGRFDIDSCPGGGTRAKLSVPMTRTRQGASQGPASRLDAGSDSK